jgi:hypothetical protein
MPILQQINLPTTALCVLLAGGCGGFANRRSEAVPQGAVVIPTRYAADRFFGVAVTARGDSVSLFLDTGDNSRIWTTSAARVGMQTESVTVNRAPARVALLPAFRAGQALPNPVLNGGRVIVTPPTDHFDSLMSSHTDGQLGSNWFTDRIWTFDYPGRRLLLHDSGAPTPPPNAHAVTLGFPTDSAGRRTGYTPRIVVEIDGDSINMLFDTGATVWLSDANRRLAGDGGPSERSSSLVWQWVFARLRQRHPDWPVIENADIATGAPMIRVPSVRIAGFDVGPVWFKSLTSAAAVPPPPPPGMPLVRTRVNGTIGGNVLRHFVVTVDYPRAIAFFTRPK